GIAIGWRSGTSSGLLFRKASDILEPRGRREVNGTAEWQRSASGNSENQEARIGGPEGTITMRKLITALAAIPVLSLGLALPPSAAVPMSHAATSCGVWRWPVKTGSDADRFKVGKTTIATTIQHL